MSRSRSRLGYFVSRCYDEGLAKASIVECVGGRDGLAAERFYTARTLPLGLVRGLKATSLTVISAALHVVHRLLSGLTATVAGYLVGEMGIRRERLPRSTPADGEETSLADAGTGSGGVLVVGSGTHFDQRREPLHTLCSL